MTAASVPIHAASQVEGVAGGDAQLGAVESAIYSGQVVHRRRSPVEHRFAYQGFQLLLDLDELPTLFQGCRLWSYERRNLASFRRRDYLGDPNIPLKDAVRNEVEQATGFRPVGPVRMLTHLRFFGLCFNPVTFYYCYGNDGGSLEAICAEITNTPWRERHRYSLLTRQAQESTAGTWTWEFPKAFHVSPFFPMEQRYRWTFQAPGDGLVVHMANLEGGSPVFDAALTLRREPLNPSNLNRCLRKHPWMTAKVVYGIYRQALALKRKRVPFHAHPDQRRSAAAAGD